MSNPTKKASTSLITIWPTGSRDEFGRVTYGNPYMVKCCVDVGSNRKLVDQAGTEFVPRMIAWYEFDGALPEIGDYMAKGDQTARFNPALAGAYPIRSVELQDCGSMSQTDDVQLGA